MSPDSAELSPSALAASLEPLMTQVYRRFRRELLEEARARALTQSQYTTLRLLADGQGRRMRDLAEHLELTNGACTAMIARLQERGLVTRQEDPQDGRGVLIRLSPAGRSLLDELVQAYRGNLTQVLSRLSTAERYMALGGLAVLSEAMAGLDAEAGGA